MRAFFAVLLASVFCFFFCHAEEKQFNMPSNPIAVIETNQGNIEVRLYPDIAPKAVENFIRLAESGYYDHTTFHRVIDNFMIQGGDPKGTGTGGESIWHKPFENEINPKVTFDKPGLLGMANAGPNTNGSQFFITTVKTPWLNGKHTIFGEVIGGFDVVKKIEAAPRKLFSKETPKEPQIILHISLKT